MGTGCGTTIGVTVSSSSIHYRRKAFVRQFFHIRQGRRPYFEIHSSVLKPTYATYVCRVDDEHKVPRPSHRPTCLWSSVEVLA
jgi:hypothetical protein